MFPPEHGAPRDVSWHAPLRTTNEEVPQEIEYRRRLESAQMPAGTEHLRHSIGWPFNDAVMHNPHTVITSYYSREHPGIGITTPQTRMHIIRSPIDATGRIYRDLSSGLFTVLLASDTSNLSVVLKELQDIVSSRLADEEFSQTSGLFQVTEGEILGNLRAPPYNRVGLAIAYKPNRRDSLPEPQDCVDPLPFLRRLY